MESKIKWGIVGPGKIARKFASDLQLVEDAIITGVGSRNLQRAQEFADEFHVPHVFGSYEELFQSSEVDVLYIATPHNFHKELAIRAMENGKHVLCEKPLGINGKEVAEIVEAAKKNKVFMMEALWSRFNPAIQRVKKLVDEGKLGQITYLHADFAFYALDRDKDSRLLNPNLASGSLLDIGIYPVFLAYLILGMPERIEAMSTFHGNGTELQTSMIFQYPEAQALLYSGFRGRSKMEAEISGTEAEVYLRPRWHEANGFSLVKNGEAEEFDLPVRGTGYFYEIMEVNQCIREQRIESGSWSHQNSLDIAELLDTIRKKCGISFPFEG
ncbi:Gfo/Idh/MocA family oxidoreductase [Allomuricauda taeanensis]|uniref:Gfo/Idh/MocA family protein n=1 Tax=Flagellimonas taeanensis TaxID=1005926 RepID=UPI002E7B5031|nr:Gfo/Idh/MocA family oxidoreductase [Allomuricauda taeanensis]MEE1963291.1 Gfo/Idh/MocA family oxidoreductase [Allomuricauda taeanensis]